jgi:Sulfatase
VNVTTFDARNLETSYPKIEPLRPPKGAPNVLVILLDDAGFAASSAFGGPCQTPNAERLARNGLKYNRFHTTALCSPTRAALLTGRNHHSVGMGAVTEFATSAPGNTSILVIAWHLLTNGKPYSDLGAGYFVKRQTHQAYGDRLVRQLERMGHKVTLEPTAA